jgi:C4-dicarboxylate-specific signal transduction histidine kinase
MDALASRDNAKLSIAILTVGSRVKLTITDNGEGIEKEIMDKIFIPFFTTKKLGTGIGLSWSRQIMRIQNGNLTLRSEEGKGTRVDIEFASA